MANNLDISTITGINQVGNSYQRKNPIPLDYYSFFNTRADAEEYAKTGAVAYVGQVIAFKESATDATVKVCVIKNEAGDLEALNNVEVKIPGIKQGTYITVTTDDKGDYIIAHADAVAMTVTPETDQKTTFVTEITRDAQGHITGYKTATLNVILDEVSISRTADDKIEIKGFAAQTENGLIPQIKIEGEGAARKKTLEWVSVQEAIAGIEDKDTVTGVKAGNDGVEVALQTPADDGDDRTYVISHADAPTTGTAVDATNDGIQGTYVTDVLVDEFGHVAGVKTAIDKDTKYDLRPIGEVNSDQSENYGIGFYEDGTIKQKVWVKGENGLQIDIDEFNDREKAALIIRSPSVELKNEVITFPEGEAPDTVPAIVGVEQLHVGKKENNENTNTLYTTYRQVNVTTKEYVDRLVSGATSYIGTVADETQLDLASASDSVNKGDFLRVTDTIEIYDRDELGNPKKDEKGEFIVLVTYHPSDMLICETSPKFDDEGNCTTPATWSVIHGEIDANTWVANTKDADGYVKAPKDAQGNYLANKVWKTDKDGNPGWGDDQDTTYTADEVSLTLDETEFSIKDGGVSTAKIADKAVTTAKLSDEVNALLGKADSAVQPGDLPVVNNGKFTVSGTGYLTGSGEMTANQAGDTTATLDLTQTTKDKIDNAMPKVPDAVASHYAMFDENGQVVDGGFIAAYRCLTDDSTLNEMTGFGIHEKLFSSMGFSGYEDAENPLLEYQLTVNDIYLTTHMEAYDPRAEYPLDDFDQDEDQRCGFHQEIDLSDAAKASLAKADSAVQYVELTELVDPEADDSGAESDWDQASYTTGFSIRVGTDSTHYTDTEFKLHTYARDGIVFLPNSVSNGSDDNDMSMETGISLAPWAKNRILDSVTEVATTANNGLKTTTTYTYYDDAQGKGVTTTSVPTNVDDYTKKTTIDIDETVTFILNCGTAADLL